MSSFMNSPDNKLHEGTKFSWDSFGVDIESTVHELVPKAESAGGVWARE